MPISLRRDGGSRMEIDSLSDEQLIARACAAAGLARPRDELLVARACEAGGGADAEAARGALFGRYHRQVAAWCLRFCGDREEAADLAQEVFLRVHERLGSFRGESRFSTWLYTVARRVAINRGE